MYYAALVAYHIIVSTCYCISVYCCYVHVLYVDMWYGIGYIILYIRLLLAEQKGALCRDDTVEGLRFYVNRFMREG